MRNRYGLVLLISLAAGLSGCAATSKNSAGSLRFGPQAWNQAPAPMQRTVAKTNPAAQPVAESAEPAAKPPGLARYFPGFQRVATEPTRFAHYRPTWFGLRPNSAPATKPAVPTTYMTDARAGLNRPMFDSTPTLPVALDVPSSTPTTDKAVTPTNAEQPLANPSASSSDPATPSTVPNPTVTVVSSKAPNPGSNEVNPLPLAIEPSKPDAPTAPDQMPQVPSVDPQTPPKPTEPEATKATSDPAETTNPSDEKAVKAFPSLNDSNLPAGLPEPTVPASYASTLVAQEAVGMKKLGKCKIFASPQTAPLVVARPTPQAVTLKVRPTSQSSPVPTSLSKPSPQAIASPQDSSTSAATLKQRSCICRMIRKVCKIGEYASPPAEAPH